MEEGWARHFSRDMFDRFIPADQRRQFLITHPIADVDSYNVIRWTPGSQLPTKTVVNIRKTLHQSRWERGFAECCQLET